MSGNVLVYVEFDAQGPRKPAIEALGAGARLAAALGTQMHAVVTGAEASAQAQAVRGFGATTVHAVSGDSLATLLPGPHAAAVAAAAGECAAGYLLFPSTAMGRDLLACVAGRLDAGVAADATAIAIDAGEVQVTRPVYAGKAIQTVAATSSPFCIGLRPNAFAAGEAGGESPVCAHAAPEADRPVATIEELREPEERQVDLTEADVIVAGGRGLKGPEHFHLIEETAAALGGVVGASRAVVDAGWRPHKEQVGQTGKTVSPTLYVACGISGAIQHLAGMSSSKNIVAINKDPDAPIFKVADYGIVGDVLEVLLALTAAILTAKGG